MARQIDKRPMRAVHDDDLDQVLASLGVLSKFRHGSLKCKCCNATITAENLHSFFPQSGSLKFVCDRYSCVRELSRLLREGTVSL